MKLLIAYLFAAILTSQMTTTKEPVPSQVSDQNQKPIFSFGILADVQYADAAPVGSRFYKSSPVKLREALNIFKTDSVNFIINLGDIIDHDFDSYKTVLDIIDSSGLQTYNVTGNHDYSVEPRLKKKIPLLLTAKESYYSINYDKFRFVFLNGNEISTYSSNSKSIIQKAENILSEMKQKGDINAVVWNGALSSIQLTWLRGQLDEAKARDEKVFIACHFSVVPENVHNLLNYKEVLSVLENYNNIVVWINGHNHAGNYGNFNMTHFVTFKGMVETEDNNSFAIVDVYRNKIWIRGYGREKSMILAY